MKLTFLEKRQEVSDAVTFIFKSKQKIFWKAGQYLFYTIPTNNPDNRGITRYLTISSASFEEHITITTRIIENSSTFKKSLMKLKVGDEVEASGPDGNFTIDDPKRNFIFIAGGIGITPFRSILLDLARKNLRPKIQLLYANHDENIIFKEELESLADKNPNLSIQYFIGENHISNSTMKQFNNSYLFYISGPTKMVKVYTELLRDIGIKKENIKTDYFPGYNNFLSDFTL